MLAALLAVLPKWSILTWLKIGGVAACVLAVAFASYEVTAAFKDAKVAKLQAADAAAGQAAEHHARTVEVGQANLSTATSTHEATAQATIDAKARVIHDKVYVHVKDHLPPSGCITYGFLRSLDGAGLGLDPADVGLPAGQSDDACAPLSAADTAAAIGDRLSDARKNAEQLDALEADVRARIDNANGKEYKNVDAPH